MTITRKLRQIIVRRSQELLFLIILGAISLIVLALADFARSQSPDYDAAAALALAQAQLKPIAKTPPVEPRALTYAEACIEAIRSNRGLVVFVGLPMPAEKYLDPSSNYLLSSRFVVVCSVPKLDGYPAKCVVYAKPNGNDINWEYTADERGKVIESPAKAVTAAASPFPDPFSPSNERRPAPRAADGDGKPAGPWAESVEFPVGMVSYQPTLYTQEIAVTNERDRISKVPRARLASKWHVNVPGGMEGITGFRSDLYKLIPVRPNVVIANIAVLNESGYFQQNRGYRRAYADGTRFDDVLSHDGKVFEHRSREKIDGKWESTVIFKDATARPQGYAGLQGQTCASCHNEAGTGGYGVGLVPGGDTVLSDPFEELESGSGYTGAMQQGGMMQGGMRMPSVIRFGRRR